MGPGLPPRHPARPGLIFSSDSPGRLCGGTDLSSAALDVADAGGWGVVIAACEAALAGKAGTAGAVGRSGVGEGGGVSSERHRLLPVPAGTCCGGWRERRGGGALTLGASRLDLSREGRER